MRVSTSGDPRLEAMFGGGNFSEASARPVVAIGRNRMPAWAFAVLAGLAALLLFVVLESRRTDPEQEAGSKTSAFPMDPPPPLALPSQYGAGGFGQDQVTPAQVPPPLTSTTPTVVRPFPPSVSQNRSASLSPFSSPLPGQQGGGVAMVIDSSGPPGPTSPTGAASAAAAGASPFHVGAPAARVRATSLTNPSNTVPQGVLIPAVLETAFHSTSAGFARAIVARDVRGFDGTKVLIPRGSRLIGEYHGSVGPSQTRAAINWTRLIRGDGVTISLSSPAVDPMGRGGVRARVNDHLFERITNSLLQSTVGIAGSLLQSNRNSVVVAVPGAANAASEGVSVGDTMRTLSVPAGTSISIFVAQDLEFQD